MPALGCAAVLLLGAAGCSLISVKSPERPLSVRDLNARILTRELSSQFVAAVARCAGDNFFKRVACEQAVGQQYCEGFWGKVPQCPSGPPNKDRGQ